MHIREYLHCLVTLDAFLNEESSYTIIEMHTQFNQTTNTIRLSISHIIMSHCVSGSNAIHISKEY